MKILWKKSLLQFFVGSILLWTSPSYSLDFSVVGTMSVANYSLNPPPTLFSGGTSFGAGALAGMDLSPFISAETGFLFLGYNSTAAVGGTSQSLSTRYLNIPLFLRLSPISFISINAGPYYATGLSSDRGQHPGDFGFMGGASLRYPLLPAIRARLDVLYQLGLTNLDGTTFTTQNSRHLVLLLGLMLEVW